MFWTYIASYSTTTLFLLLLSASISLRVNADCYWPNRTLAPDDTPCFSGLGFSRSGFSQCCGTNWTCLSDGVCQKQFDSSQYYYRGTCSDKAWASPDCPLFCLGQSNQSQVLSKCSNSIGNSPQYCCFGDDACDCSTGKNTVKIIGPETTVTIIFATSWSTYSSTSSASTSSATALSKGAVAGIVVGAIAALFIGLGAGCFLSCLRKRRRQSSDAHGSRYSSNDRSGYMGHGISKAPQELQTSEAPVELDSRSRRTTQSNMLGGGKL